MKVVAESSSADVDGAYAVFSSWVTAAWPAMTGLALRYVGAADADDVVQDTLAAAWRARERFDPSRGSATTWLLMLTADHARRHRRRAHLVAVPQPGADGVALDPAGPDPDIARAMAMLSDRQRLAVELFYYLDLPVADVAAVMGCSPGTVKSTLSDARARLRDTLGGDFR